MAANSNSNAARFYVLTSVFIVVAALYFARDLLIPVALAVFLSFLLAPLANRIEKVGLGRIPAALASVLLAFAILAGVGFLITEQFISLAHRLPEYEDNIRARVTSVQRLSSSVFGRTTRSIRGFRQEFSSGSMPATGSGQEVAGAVARAEVRRHEHHVFHNPKEEADGGLTSEKVVVADAEHPIPVTVMQPEKGVLDYLAGSISTLVGPLGDSLIVVVLAVFMLLQRRDLRDRLIALTGRSQIYVTTQAFDEMTRRISRYLIMQLVVNTCYAVPLAIGLGLFGIPNAMLWGLVGLVLRFIPYVGAWVMAAIATLLAVAVYPSWWGPIGVLVFLAGLELFLNNVIEPWLYSVGSGISILGVMLSAVFWAWLWGPVGLLLATPIAVCLTVMGRYIPQLEFLDVLLGGTPTLEPKLRFLQRLLAMDQDEASEVAEEFHKTYGLMALYDRLIVPALQLAEQERHHGQVSDHLQAYLHRSFREIIDDAADRDAHERSTAGTKPSSGEGDGKGSPLPAHCEPAPLASETRVLCLPAGDEADELAGLMLEHLLRAQGYYVDTASVEYLSSELVAEVEQTGAHVVIISALPPGALVAARYLCKRVSLKWPRKPVVVGLWNATGDTQQARARLQSAGATRLVTSYSEALADIARVAQTAHLMPA